MKNDTAIFEIIAKRVHARAFGIVSIPQSPRHGATLSQTDEALKQRFPRIVITAKFQLGRGPTVAERALLLVADEPKHADPLKRYLSKTCEKGSRSILFKDAHADAIYLLRPSWKNHPPLETRVGLWDAKMLPRYHALMLFYENGRAYRCSQYDIATS